MNQTNKINIELNACSWKSLSTELPLSIKEGQQKPEKTSDLVTATHKEPTMLFE